MGDAAYNGPYKATRVWNDVIIAFRQYLPCGRHRRYMKTYNNCFSGASATDWLLQYLKTHGNFGSDVSREKATSLINKLYRAGVFEEVQVSKSMRHKQDVQENRLYKFLPITPSKVKISRLPLAPRNDSGVNYTETKVKSSSHNKHDFTEEIKQKPVLEPDVHEKKHQSTLARKLSILKKDKTPKEPPVSEKEESYPACHLVAKVLTTREIKCTWKAAFIAKTRKILGVKNLDDIISADLIDGYNVMHNCIYLNKSGIVTNIDANQQLPHWVMSAMKCLARWPEPAEPGLPSYPGFEKDVFGVVKDYFLNQDQPLVPYNLYDVVTNIFVMVGNSQARHSSPHRYDSESNVSNTLWSSASLENIILNLTKKYCTLDNTGDRYGTHEDLQLTNGWFTNSPNENHGGGYSHNTFPSTDGMDNLGQSQNKVRPFSAEQQSYGLSNQESCPSLSVYQRNRAPNSLSRTSQSAKEANSHSDKWLSGISRKYGSTPNLKVSRFETAFGPDNRTVTRVFYQNGMTTDFGHDEEERSFSRQNGFCGNDIDRVQSNNCLYDDGADVRRKAHPLNDRPVARSKSFADVKHNAMLNNSTETISSRKFNTSFNGSIVRSSSCNGNNSKLNTSSHGTLMNSSKEALYEADNQLYNALEGPVEKVFENSIQMVQSPRSDTVTTFHDSSLPLTRLTVNPHEVNTLSSVNNLNRSPCQPLVSLPTASNLSASPYVSLNEEKRNSSFDTRPPGTAGDYGPGYKQRSTTHSERPISSLSYAKSTSSYDIIQEQRLSCDSALLLRTSSSTQNRYDPGYMSLLETQETKYNIVLDASKKQSVPCSTHPAPYNRIQSTFNQTANHLSSRPCSPHYHTTASVNDLDHISGLAVSSITPFSSQNSQSGRKPHLSTFMNYPQTSLSEDRVKNSLQMVTLLLPPANRRKLHLLFKMMMKMTLNPNLCLDPTQTTRSLVLGTFYPAIVRSHEDCDLDEVVQLQLMSFMLDYYDDIFTPPSDLKTLVSDKLKTLQRPQVVYSPKPDRTVRFCQQTSLSDFENQRISSSQTGLASLLEDIVSDQNMHIKEKQKRLKQFQNTYPAIYCERFPDATSEAKVLPQNPKLKQPLIAKPLSKLRSLRL